MSAPAGQREVVYCHECEEEWFRDAHGLTCPRCQSDFTQIVEPGHDPRDDMMVEQQAPPDPDEDDITDARWHGHDGDEYGRNWSYQSSRAPHHDRAQHLDHAEHGNTHQHQQQQGASALPPMMGAFASIFNTIMGARSDEHAQTQTPQTARSNNAPPWQERSGTWTRQGGGPSFSWSITTQTGPSMGSRPAPPGMTPDLPSLMDWMHSTHGGPTSDPFGRSRDPFARPHDPFGNPHDPFGHAQHDHFHANALANRGDNPFVGMSGPFGPLFASLFSNPALMHSGDAVHSQEALDRIISQLMDQHASGNAPGPAPQEAIASLPKRAINEKDLGPEHTAECSICMDEVNLGEQVTELPCHHWFHGDCIKAWLNEHDTCPHCRQGIIPKDEPPNSNRVRSPNEIPRHDQMWGQGNGTQSHPWIIPDSPSQSSRPSDRRRHSSNAGPSGTRSNRSSGASNNEGLLSRMRNAFGGGGGNGS